MVTVERRQGVANTQEGVADMKGFYGLRIRDHIGRVWECVEHGSVTSIWISTEGTIEWWNEDAAIALRRGHVTIVE